MFYVVEKYIDGDCRFSGVFGFLSLAHDIGAERALVKPFHKQEILEAVDELLKEA